MLVIGNVHIDLKHSKYIKQTFKTNNMPINNAYKTPKFEEMLDTYRKNGNEYLIITDGDTDKWECGLADYLMQNYRYSNMKCGFRVNITEGGFIHRIPSGDFADPNY